MSSVAYQAKRTYAAVLHTSGKALSRIGVLPKQVPDRRRRWAHWAVSLPRVYDSLAIVELGVPWWTYDAIDAVDTWLAARDEPARVFEYGSGASTFWLAARVGSIDSVEHHRGFAESLQPKLAELPNVRLHVVEAPPSASPEVASVKSGSTGLEFRDYVATIDAVGGEFDLVVVDGRVRAACLAAAARHLAPGGMILFDNSRRRRYRVAIEASGLVEERYSGLTPTLPYPDQTSLLQRAGDRHGSGPGTGA